jgi:protoporphyrinogen/coproporphyrinogen III oxidase
MRVGVVGAGPAGLSAAWQLSEQGAQVALFERRAEAGGKMRTDAIDGVKFDPGAQLLASTYTATLALANAARAGNLLVRSPGRDAIWRRGKTHALVYGSVASMITSGALPTGLKLKLGARYLPFLGLHTDKLDLHDLVGTGGLKHDRESIAAWGKREIGDDFIDLLAHPQLGAYYGSTPEETSAALYHALARVGLSVELRAVVGGLQELPRAIAARLAERGVQLHYDSVVERIEVNDRAATIHHANGADSFDAVVSAVPAVDAARALTDLPAIRDWLAGVRVKPAATLALVLSRPLAVDYFGASIPRTEPEAETVAAVCIQDRKVIGLVPPGRGALVVLPAAGFLTEGETPTPEQLLDRLLPTVERIFPGVRSTIVQARATSFPAGYTIFYPGYVSHLKAFAALPMPKRLALAGDYLVAPTVEGAVRSGSAAARRIAQSISGS